MFFTDGTYLVRWLRAYQGAPSWSQQSVGQLCSPSHVTGHRTRNSHTRGLTKPQFSQNSRIKIGLGDRRLSLTRTPRLGEEKFRENRLLYEIRKSTIRAPLRKPLVQRINLALKQSARPLCTIFSKRVTRAPSLKLCQRTPLYPNDECF